MNHLFDYGEFLLCIGPIFLVVGLVGGILIWNAVPPREIEKEKQHDEK